MANSPDLSFLNGFFFNFQISIGRGQNVTSQMGKEHKGMCNCSSFIQNLSQCLKEITNEILYCTLKKQANPGITAAIFCIQVHLCPLLKFPLSRYYFSCSTSKDNVLPNVSQRLLQNFGFHSVLDLSDSLQGVIHCRLSLLCPL